MVLRKITTLVCLVLVCSCGNKTKTGTPTTPEGLPDGAALYIENCASCHGADGTLGKAGSKDLTKLTKDFQQIKKIIEEGTQNGMPRFKEILGGDEEVEAVVQHIIGFKRING